MVGVGVGQAKLGHNFAFKVFHGLGFFFAKLVVVACKVEHPVHHKVLQVFGQWLVHVVGFAHQYGHAHKNIAYVPFLAVGHVFVGYKAQHVGCVVLVPEVAVQLAPFNFATKPYRHRPWPFILVGAGAVGFFKGAHLGGGGLAQVGYV